MCNTVICNKYVVDVGRFSGMRLSVELNIITSAYTNIDKITKLHLLHFEWGWDKSKSIPKIFMKCNSGRRLETKWCWFSLETSMMLLSHFLHILTTGQLRCLLRPQNVISSVSCAHNAECYGLTIHIDFIC